MSSVKKSRMSFKDIQSSLNILDDEKDKLIEYISILEEFLHLSKDPRITESGEFNSFDLLRLHRTGLKEKFTMLSMYR